MPYTVKIYKNYSETEGISISFIHLVLVGNIFSSSARSTSSTKIHSCPSVDTRHQTVPLRPTASSSNIHQLSIKSTNRRGIALLWPESSPRRGCGRRSFKMMQPRPERDARQADARQRGWDLKQRNQKTASNQLNPSRETTNVKSQCLKDQLVPRDHVQFSRTVTI